MQGSLRVTDTTYTTNLNLSSGTASQIVKTDANKNLITGTLSKSDVGLGNVANSTYAGGTAVTLNGTSKAASTASFYAPTAAGTSGQYLKSTGGVPEWASFSSSTVGLGNVSNNANLNGTTGAKGDIIYWSAANTPAHLANTSSTTKNFLSITSQVPAWTTLAKGDVGLGNVTNDAQVKASLGTTKGDMVYWSANATPARLAIGTAGQFLKAATNGPEWAYVTNPDITPIKTKTYTGVTVTANSDPKGWLYFFRAGRLSTATYNDIWRLTYRVTAYCAGQVDSRQVSVVHIDGVRNTYTSYWVWNSIGNTSYRPIYGHPIYFASSDANAPNYAPICGLRFQSSYEPTNSTYARTITFDILEQENCDVTFFDAGTLYSTITEQSSTAYFNTSRTSFDGTTQGITTSGDRNSNDSSLTYERYNHTRLTNTTAWPRYGLAFTHPTDSTKVIPVNSTDNVVADTKTTITGEAFNIFDKIYYRTAGSNLAANSLAAVGDAWYAYSALDLRYSFNLTTTSLTAHKDVYLVCSLVTPTTATLRGNTLTGTSASTLSNNTGPITQTLPSSDDGYIYIKLGRSYSAYQITLTADHPIYWYKDGAIRAYNSTTKAIIGLGNVENTKLSTWTGSSSITTLGTISSGTVPWARLSNVPTASTTAAGIIQIGTGSGNAAAGNHGHGNIQNGGTLQTTDITISTGDKLVVTDGDNSSKIARTSLSFDGSTTTKFLAQKGTWETVASIIAVDVTATTANSTTINNSLITANHIALNDVVADAAADITVTTEAGKVTIACNGGIPAFKLLLTAPQ